MATVYSDRGLGVARPGGLLQPLERSRGASGSRAISIGLHLRAGVRWFHSGRHLRGALRKPPPRSSSRPCRAAKAAGAVVSFDLNLIRAKLWSIFGGEQRAASVLDRIRPQRGCAGGQRGGSAKGLGIAGPEVAAKSKLDPSVFSAMTAR